VYVFGYLSQRELVGQKGEIGSREIKVDKITI
jgi:hypothetical protein